MNWSLWLPVTIALVLQLSVSEALKCHTDEDTQNPDEFQEVAAMCMKNTSGSEQNRNDRENKRNGNNYHKTNSENTNDNWNNGGMGQTFPGYNSENEGYGFRGSSRCNANGNGYNNNNNNRNNMNQNNMNGMRQRPQNRNRRSGQQSESADVDLEDIQPCAVHCIFRQMGMLGDDALPDRSAVAKVMLRGVKDTEVKDFVQEAVEDCFDQVESDRKGSKCEFSKNVALCLRQKGRENCEDWGEQDDQQSNQNKNGNNNGDNNNGNNNNGNNNNGNNNNNNNGNNNGNNNRNNNGNNNGNYSNNSNQYGNKKRN